MAGGVSLGSGKLIGTRGSGVSSFRGGTGRVLHITEIQGRDVGRAGEIVIGRRWRDNLESHGTRLASTGRRIQDGDVVGAAERTKQNGRKSCGDAGWRLAC